MRFYHCTATITSGLLLAAACLSLPARGEEAPSAAGFVAAITGTGHILRKKDTIMISGMDLLYAGDSVRLSKGAKARITLCGSRGYEVRGAAVFAIRGSGIVFKEGSASKTYRVDKKTCAAALDVFRKNAKGVPDMVTGERRGTLILRSKKKSERRGVYVVRGRKHLPVIEILSDRLMPGNPVLAWNPVPGRGAYRVAITAGGETIWSATAEKNRCEYPDTAPRLTEGRLYDITVEALSGKGDVIARGSGALSLPAAADIESYRQEESSIMALFPGGTAEREIMLGKMHEARGDVAAALSCYEKAIALDSGNSGLRERVRLLKQLVE